MADTTTVPGIVPFCDDATWRVSEHYLDVRPSS